MHQRLTDNKTLWVVFVASLLITFLFPVLAAQTGLVFLDGLSDPADARSLISSWTDEQRGLHALITATLDVLYPLVYGAWFAGSALCFYSRAGVWLAWLFAVLVGVDLLEGVVQVLALLDIADVLAAKQVLTPAKFLLFFVGLAVVAGGWMLWFIKRLRGKPTHDTP